jgi:hypothetical protein
MGSQLNGAPHFAAPRHLEVIDQVDTPDVADADLALARGQCERLQDMALPVPLLPVISDLRNH